MPHGQYTRRTPANAAPVAGATPSIEQPVSPRAAEMRRERRRRNDGDLDGMAHLKLSVPKEIQERLKREGKVYRFFLESNVPGAYQNDWDVVDGADQVVANPIAAEQDRLVLCSKFKDWHESDQRSDEEILADRDQAMMSGQVSADGRSSEGLVVPAGQTNRITQQKGL